MHKNLIPYISFVDFVANTFGPDYEVALHSFTPQDTSIVAIANGHVSGREVGSPLNKKALEAIKKGVYKDKSFVSDYASVSSNGKVLRSNTYFIKDNNDELIGLLCVNFDDSRYRKVMNDIMELCHPNNFIEQKYIYKDTGVAPLKLKDAQEEELENFHKTMEETVDSALAKIVLDKRTTLDRLTLSEKVEIVGILQDSGIFYIRGAVKYVSEKINCSQATLYRYLKKFKYKAIVK